ncbi:glycosyltransferase involved in cell wall biosynthesis [Halanaerobium congolense]|jgi:glycosyltransferase involved in cell wall biosynthesis|uniref:Glycosyltransferase involved in cell wall biosynthesis n=1 Tax=Halanaerobium congolense TaxID=54121 RepID=A0A318DYU6_9FIRM|nr:glycosyltransferase [Halanaerobium congolense]PXV63074.1 glycosyltransferase involved in cell wall biosynthesis [Halanaerobium congolense]
MNICFIAGASTIHTVRWVNAMANKGHEVSLITQHKEELNSFETNVDVYELPIKNNSGYYLNYPVAKYYINKIKPDIINTHYASGYGTLSRLINFTPTLLSVWGSDVYDFPNQSDIKKDILKKNLAAATEIASTSHVMKKQTERFVNGKEIHITPFGIDLEKFSPDKYKKNLNMMNIGIVKKLAPKYGIEYLIRSFAILVNEKNILDKTNKKIKLTIVGKGEQRSYLEELAKELEIAELTDFVGVIPYNEVPDYLNTFDIFCAPSTLDSESFGVAIIEASACELPVVVSDVGGLPEVVDNGETGYVVPSKDPEALADKLYELIFDQDKRKLMGKKGREKVEQLYDWGKNVDKMEEIYQEMIKKYK